jgi:hypothetical protein
MSRTRIVPVQFRELRELCSRNRHRMFQHEPSHVFARRSREGPSEGVIVVIGGKQLICIYLDILIEFDFFLLLGQLLP